MCLLVVCKPNSTPSRQDLHNGACSNPHGYGFAIVADGRIITERSMSAKKSIRRFLQLREQYPNGYAMWQPLWDFIEDMRANYNARSWDTDSCGLHVHVSRSAFKSGAHTHRFLTLIYKNPKEMMKLAGRKNSRYAQFSDVYQPDEWGIPRFNLRNKIHGKHYTERYSAVNTQNDYTLELRFFRGTMARAGIMSALELTHAATEYTRNLSLADVKLGMLQWEWFASWVEANNGIYPNLYIKMSKIQKVSLENREILNA